MLVRSKTLNNVFRNGGYVSPGHSILAHSKIFPCLQFSVWERVYSLEQPNHAFLIPRSFHLQFLGQFLITCSKGLEVIKKQLSCFELIVCLHTLWSPKGNIRCSRQSQLCNMIGLVQLQAIWMHSGPNPPGVTRTQLCNMICLVQLQAIWMHSGPNLARSRQDSTICLVQAIRMHPGPNTPGVASTQLCNMIGLVQLQVIWMHSGHNLAMSRQYSLTPPEVASTP